MPGERSLRLCVVAPLVLVLLLAIQPAAGHAVLLEAAPAANSTVQGPSVSIHLRFNSRIDGARSRLTLVRPDGASEGLKIAEQSSPDTLASEAAGLKPGAYRIHWQVLATDGHVTRGDIPFTVAGR
jgi:copper resistance protein C